MKSLRVTRHATVCLATLAVLVVVSLAMPAVKTVSRCQPGLKTGGTSVNGLMHAALEGYVDLTLGHVSAREPDSRTIWIKRKGPALDEVEPADVIALDLDDPVAQRAAGTAALLQFLGQRFEDDVFGGILERHQLFQCRLTVRLGQEGE